MKKWHFDILTQASDQFYRLADDPDAKVRNRGDCVFSADHPKVKDNKDHFPVNSESEAHAALSYANHYSASPDWYDGDLSSLVSAVARKVKAKFPSIEVTEKASHPGKD